MPGKSAFFGVGHLSRIDLKKIGFGHVGAGEHSAALFLSINTHHQRCIAQGFGTGFEEQRNVEHDKRSAQTSMVVDESDAVGEKKRVYDGFERFQAIGLLLDPFFEALTIDTVFGDGLRAELRDCIDRGPVPFVKTMNRRVGIPNRNPGLAEKGCSGAFAHANGAGKAKNDHVFFRTMLRSFSSTVGFTPNHFSNAGTA